MGFGKGLILGTISLLLIISISLSITLYSSNALLHPEIYKSSLEKNNVYKQMGSEFENESRKVIDSSLENFLSYLNGNSNSVGDSEFAQISGMDSDDLEKLKGYVILFKRIFYASIILSFVLIILIFILSKNFFSSSKILGMDLFLVGISMIFSVAAGKPILNNALSKTAQGGTEILKPLVSDIFSEIFGKINFYGYIFVGIGAIIFALFWILQKRRNEQ